MWTMLDTFCRDGGTVTIVPHVAYELMQIMLEVDDQR